jgi:hypothetical protein
MLHKVFLFVHVLSAFLYLLVHGGSVAVAFQVRREKSAERVRALLDLSRGSVLGANLLLLSTILFGIALGFMGHWWRTGWIWTSIAVLVLVMMVMGRMAAPWFARMRGAVGLVFADKRWKHTGEESSPEELAVALASGNAMAISLLSMGGWAVVLWLMLFKPF